MEVLVPGMSLHARVLVQVVLDRRLRGGQHEVGRGEVCVCVCVCVCSMVDTCERRHATLQETRPGGTGEALAELHGLVLLR
jgi:hypothetical protein